MGTELQDFLSMAKINVNVVVSLFSPPVLSSTFGYILCGRQAVKGELQRSQCNGSSVSKVTVWVVVRQRVNHLSA